MGKLDGKVALVSGAARGQGEAEARLFAREGASVALGDLRDEDDERVAASIVYGGDRALYPTSTYARDPNGARWSNAPATSLAA